MSRRSGSPSPADPILPGRRSLVAAGTAGLALSALAGNGVVPAGGTLSAAEVQALLKRVQEATQRHSFSGVYVVSSAGSVTSSRIVHVAEGREQYERIEALDGQKRTVFRHNDVVHTFWPRDHEAAIQQREQVLDFPAPLASVAVAGLPMYQVQLTGEDRVAGVDVQVVTLKPRDAWRFAQRWWLDRQTGLLLRSDTLGEQGEVLESAAFTEIHLGARASGHQVMQEMNRLDGFRVRRPAIARTELEREGWRLRETVAGFEPLSCVRRPVAWRTAADRPESVAGTAAATMLQSIYTDGLTHVSLFIEAYNAAVHLSETPAAMGATHVVPRHVGDWWVTAVGDVPSATLRQFSSNLERRKP